MERCVNLAVTDRVDRVTGDYPTTESHYEYRVKFDVMASQFCLTAPDRVLPELLPFSVEISHQPFHFIQSFKTDLIKAVIIVLYPWEHPLPHELIERVEYPVIWLTPILLPRL
jgi:hypothetical protein